MTPLHLLSMLGAPKAIDWCIQHGAKLHVKGMEGGTPMFWAAHCRKEDSIRELVKHGANVNTRNS